MQKKVVAWFNVNKETQKENNFGFLFRGKESYHYMHNFRNLIFVLKIYVKKQNQVLAIFYESLYLQRLASYLVVVIIGISIDDIHQMKSAGQKLFKKCTLFDSCASPCLWCFTQATAGHAKSIFSKLRLKLGCNKMEDREQKHQQIDK